eukprot:GHVN01008866.1.p2 GENE.GHVN01008866.1~~GHVN01008866.1.p2  ORF type:complete len:165 (+),score=13.20 GHVN01008866.1:119-613(+)
MVSLRPMTVYDLFRMNTVNLDVFTENFNAQFYLQYLTKWPSLCVVVDAPDGTMAGYIIGKVEGHGKNWHGHVTALSVAPEFRRTKLALRLMNYLEKISDLQFNCYFVDLFVRVSNTAAVKFYEQCTYEIYDRVEGYYNGDEDALDLRKPLSRDVDKSCLANSKK